MKTTNRLIGVLAGCAILASVGGLFAQDWPQWRGANRDGKVTGFTPPATWPKTLAQKWKVPVGLGDSSPVLVGNRLYVFARQGSDEVTLCLNAADGKEIWKNSYAGPTVAGPSASQHSGPRSTPTVAEGKVITLGTGGVLSCLNAANGALVWRKDDIKTFPQFYTGMSPIVVDGMCIAHLGGPSDGTIIAFDLTSGNQKWKWTGDGPGYSSPTILTVGGTKQIVEETDKSVVGISVADGKLLWQVPFVGARMAYNAPTAIVDGDTVIYTGGGRGMIAVKIEKAGDTFTPKEAWKNADIATQFNTPVLKDGFLYGLSDKNRFFCVNAKTGVTAWNDATNRTTNYGAMLDAGLVIIALPSNSTLIAFKANDKAYEELASIKIAETPTFAHPIVDGNKVFVKDKDSLALLAIE